MRILIADDYEPVRRGVRLLLSSLDKAEICGESANGNSAVSQARRLRPDLVIMELNPPRVGGFEAVQEIRRLLPKAQILVLSQYEAPEVVKAALAAGAVAYVKKSAIWKLTATVRGLLSGETPPSDLDLSARTQAAVLEFPKNRVSLERDLPEYEERIRATEQTLAQAERELKIVGRHLGLVSKHMNMLTTRCSRDLKYLWVNENYANWLKRPAEQIVGRRIVDVIGKDAFQALEDRFHRVLEGEEVRYDETLEFEGIGLRHISAAYQATLDSRGVADGWLASIRNI